MSLDPSFLLLLPSEGKGAGSVWRKKWFGYVTLELLFEDSIMVKTNLIPAGFFFLSNNETENILKDNDIY